MKPYSVPTPFLVVVAALLSVAFLKAATPMQPIEAPDKADKCEVCHNGKNPHTLFIPCDKVNRYLASHPGDTAGPCQNVSPEKPPKGNPGGKP